MIFQYVLLVCGLSFCFLAVPFKERFLILIDLNEFSVSFVDFALLKVAKIFS
jgi:hypothetical protein